jgi:hypothetical protein
MIDQANTLGPGTGTHPQGGGCDALGFANSDLTRMT